MRPLSPFIAVLVLVPWHLFSASDAQKPGPPAGWSALQYDNYGNDLLNKQQFAESRKYFDAALRLEPSRWTAYYNRATAYLMEGNLKAGLEDLNETIRLKPAFFVASWMRAGVYTQLGNYAAALQDLDALAKGSFQAQEAGHFALILNQRAWIHATCANASLRNAQLAVADATRACDVSKWKGSSYIDTLAAAYAESGDFQSAIRYEEQAIALNKSGSDESLKSQSESKKYAEELARGNPQRAKGYAERLELYKHHRPYRNPSKG